MMDDKQTKLFRSYIATLDDQVCDWRASQQSLAVSFLECFDEWCATQKEQPYVSGPILYNDKGEEIARPRGNVLPLTTPGEKILVDALQQIKDKAKSWEGHAKAPYWNLGDIAAAALKRYGLKISLRRQKEE